MPAELIAPELENRERLDVLPNVYDFFELSNSSGNKEKVLENKLLMRPGTHNEVIYNWDDLKEAVASGEEAGLFYDHDDSTRNYAGYVKNLKADENKKEIRGDLVILEDQAYNKLKAGAKWGISPTIDAEKVVKDGKKYAVDPRFHSFSFVLRPAVRDTMLNSKELKGGKTRMSEEDNKEELAQAKKKVSEKDKEIESLQKELESYKVKERDEFSKNILDLEKQIGFTSEANADSRLKELKEMSSETRKALKSIHDNYVKKLDLDSDEKDEDLSAYTDFVKKMRKKGKSMKEIGEAWDKKKGSMAAKKKKKKYPYPYPYPKKQSQMAEEGSEESSEEDSSDEEKKDEEESKENLSEKKEKVNKGMLEFMKEQERK